MTRLQNWFRSTPNKLLLLAFVLILSGLAIMIPKGLGMLDFAKEARYARDNEFYKGNPSPELIRPWMSIRYVSTAYSVPQGYIYDVIKLQPSPNTSMIAINRLNRQLGLGNENGEPKLLHVVRDTVIRYREKPVATGLLEGRVEGWMTAQYIANSIGIPVERIFQGINLPVEGNQYLVLDFLANSQHYPGGRKALIAAIQAVVDTNKRQP